MKSLIAIRHVDFEDLGSWESFLSKDYKIKYIDAVDPAISLLRNENIGSSRK